MVLAPPPVHLLIVWATLEDPGLFMSGVYVLNVLPYSRSFLLSRAVLPRSGAVALVMECPDGGLHDEATDWLGFLEAAGKSPNTARAYGLRLAAYLTWSADSGRDWRHAGLSDLVEWKTAVIKPSGHGGDDGPRPRKAGTVNAWMTAVVEFYKWAEASGLIE